ncbi:SCO2523 family variant P-loop protein [Stackebrandtia nassauensis]|uniref:CobQ/CobB/MinD/ParA nucleotide binding domain-containing protein n=1 Tax=Stackebrandtia nassauensis (strain DSM 44728 / CIP 108903 / NRRL B-16338 / NBRC 102104 / LLR-40K-21) TaxID=446470 RepID=D3QB56_STANL|nr:SCO2523 family variant P-loop protein [Stackebrandtia nassauensis]ADD40873.1 hypothetical protein Snas_1163 [Stackebrandtia nassauensis DSM 44728]
MLVFATSDKGGTGRSVTSCNLAYRSALRGKNVCYVDYDFGSPTAGAVFGIEVVARGTDAGGLHEYLLGHTPDPHRVNVWDKSERNSIRRRPDTSGDLVLMPGDRGGGEFASSPEIVERCTDLFLRLEEQFDISIVDLSAGRSYAAEIVLGALAAPDMEGVVARWLIHHRWTRQHILAAAGLLDGERGILDIGVQLGHDKRRLRESVRYVRTAVVDPDADDLAGLRAPQVAWLHDCNDSLNKLASREAIGRANTLGDVPLDPVLQWREQILTESDTHTREIANVATVRAFEDLADRLTDDVAWEAL